MLYKFRSKATGDVIMTAPVGDKVLRAMGREPAAQGIFEAAALSELLASIEAAIAADEAGRAAGKPQDAESATTPAQEGISLKQRAWPLIEMMRRALAVKADIVWGA